MAETTTTPASTEQETEIVQPRSRRRGIIIIVVAIIAVAALAFWWHSTFYEDTDDAQVSGHLIQVSSRIQGQVLHVDVAENQVVKKGDPIAELDPRDYQVAVENAKAALASAQAAAQAANVAVPLTTINTGSNLTSANAQLSGSHAQVQQAQGQLQAAQARVTQAQANATKAQNDLERYKPLVEKDVISKQQFDAAVAANAAAQAAVADATASAAAAADAVRVARQQEAASEASVKYAQTGPQQIAAQNAHARQAAAQVQQAQAQLDQAELNLSYTKIVAPDDGIITRKSVEVNQNVSSGQNLLTLVSLSDIWVTANFKETQLKHMGPNQPVEISVDATGKSYPAHVTQIGGATGSVLSLFPPENATGNYVKVVQRVPVRIDFDDLKRDDPNHQLRPGLSVEPKVRVKQ
ncbi:HlyD family secretion protein [Occallatibacter riparius]|uniref:HlyD family secretion protein n=1 Tax=Occallatibacter riparius TaxID=1002689 RepID=A0A9J7BYY9_9BACT|nr:HlyD family secretion protein [Occallatibacter riparius]UWZ86702.1 HlyD family secretion protein [Occallatibacter riparius]